ncbi:ISAs1 family transposase [Bremerella cremea]|uniref:ISAs1 family transposase n=1 Tax=Bremerella cremea TaxID=1031537 RepID=A0A368KM62_9BACT|nr:ISAs1 family transposase [Bremerella cremea]
MCGGADDIPHASKWTKLKTIGMTIKIVKQNGKETSDVRYNIVSNYLSGKRFAEAVRGQWSIENSLHWQLDETFGEDRSRIRKGHAYVNFSLLRRTILSLLKYNKTAKVSVKNKRLKAGRNVRYLLEVVLGK